MTAIDVAGDLHAAVVRAERAAFELHRVGRCGESQWSCSWCDDQAGAS